MIDDFDREAEEILHECMTNSYMIITNKLTFDDLLDYNGCALPFNPKKNIDNKKLFIMIKKNYEKFLLKSSRNSFSELKRFTKKL